MEFNVNETVIQSFDFAKSSTIVWKRQTKKNKTTNFTITTIKQQQSVEGAQNEIIPAPPVLLRGARFAHTEVWLCCLSTKLLLLRQTGAICLNVCALN